MKGQRIHTSQFGTFYKLTVIRPVWYWHKDRLIDQWNKPFIINWFLVRVPKQISGCLGLEAGMKRDCI